MKKATFFILLLFVFKGSLFSQAKTLPNSFILQGDFDKSKTEFFKNSILAASMETYRLKESDVVLKFKEGFECVIFSAKKCFLQGANINVNDYKTEFNADYYLPIFSIDPSGHILAEVKRSLKYK